MFLTQSNPKKADDLELWTYQQLAAVVTQFKNSKPKIIQESSKEGVVEDNLDESPLRKLKALDDGTYIEEIKCEPKLINSIYTHGQTLKIKVIRWDKV